jgi:hypothetical protein
MDEFEIVLTQMPYVGGAASRMSDFFMRLMGFMAIGRVLRRHGVALPVIGDIERESYKAHRLKGSPQGVSSCLQKTKPCCASKPQEALPRNIPKISSTISLSPVPATALSSESITKPVVSANSLLVTEIKKSCHTFADLISKLTQPVAFVWNGYKRWLAARASAIFGSPTWNQSRTCRASALGLGRVKMQRRANCGAGLWRATVDEDGHYCFAVAL